LRELCAPDVPISGSGQELRLSAAAELAEAKGPDPLAEWISRRSTFRGTFASTTPTQQDALCALLRSAVDVIALADRQAIEEIAALDDRYTLEALRRPDYHRELYQWMRFSKRHPDWSRDGLNAPCMALDRLERLAGPILFHPAVFPALVRLGPGGLLTSSADKTRSAAAVALLLAPGSEDPFDTGRHLYRLWLEIQRLGLSLCPMSVLVDAPSCRAYLQARWGVPAGSRITSVLRIGKAPSAVPVSARLPSEELLV
jgi:hypothetical protein